MELKERLLQSGCVFTSETDVEVIAHLISRHYEGDLAAAVRAAFAELRGHYAFVAMHADEPDLLVGARRECPLVVGRGDGEQYIASAVPAFLAQTRRVQYVENEEIVVLRPDDVDDLLPGRHRDRARDRRGRLGRGHRREGRLRDVHAQGDPRAGRGGRLDDRRPRGARDAHRRPQRGGGARREHPRRHHADRDRRLRDLLPRRPHRSLRDRGLGAHPGRGRRRLGVPLPRPDRRSGRPRHRDLPVRRDGRHARGDAPRARARRDACSRSRT